MNRPIRQGAFHNLIITTASLACAALSSTQARAQTTNAPAATNIATRLPAVIVTAQKEPQTEITLPLSVTAVTRQTLQDDDIDLVKQAAKYAPNTFINEFTAPALSNPFFRGIGGSPLNPAVTTFIDGVPQLNSYSSSIQFSDVDQVEFVRGPQGALFGRNTAGGLINITSRAPSDVLTGEAEGSVGNYGYGDVRGSVSGPVVPGQLDLGLSGGYTSRNGYTQNDFNGNPADDRMDEFGKSQLLFKANDRLDFRFIVYGEHDRDGDYSLGDLGYIRASPDHTDYDFTDGFNHRDIAAGTLLADYNGDAVEFHSISGVVWWKNEGLTDLDYGVASPNNGLLYGIRDNTEEEHQFTQEFRFGSAKDNPIKLSDDLDLSWQSGVFLFSQSYTQNALNSITNLAELAPPPAPPVLLATLNPTTADLDDLGVGVYGQAKVTAWDKVDLSAGLRFDGERKSANLTSGNVNVPDLGQNSSAFGDLSKNYSEVSPQFSADFRYVSNQMVYASIARGYRAGGFNPGFSSMTFPAGSQQYGPEHTWNYEIGHKALWLDGKLETTLALFYIDWKSLQLNQAVPGVADTYYVANAGGAYSRGVEAELKYRPCAYFELFGSAGYDDAHFTSASTAFNANTPVPGAPAGSYGVNQGIGGDRLPFAPLFTANVGAEVSWSPCHYATLYARAEATVTGEFRYDAFSNTPGDQGQATYTITDFRAGIRGGHWFLEGFADNAFDTHYVPIAIQYAQLGAPSGYVGEIGAPATFGARAGLHF
jgi:iron complex outermembrane receptor protein